MISIKEYADSKGVTKQAIYKQLKTYIKALDGYIIKSSG